jgi:hypothetical protein
LKRDAIQRMNEFAVFSAVSLVYVGDFDGVSHLCSGEFATDFS